MTCGPRTTFLTSFQPMLVGGGEPGNPSNVTVTLTAPTQPRGKVAGTASVQVTNCKSQTVEPSSTSWSSWSYFQ